MQQPREPFKRIGIDEAKELIAAGKVDVEGLVSHRMPLERLAEGVDLMRRRQALKVYVTP